MKIDVRVLLNIKIKNYKSAIYDLGIYIGDWVRGVMQGIGVFTYTNGDKYDGEWKNNMMHGQGVFEHNKGDIYNGTWKNNKKSGI